ncbi:hypothetical protein DFQ27_008210, partial [Actinomortierella ambigua]
MRERGQRDIEAQRHALAIMAASRRGPSGAASHYTNPHPHTATTRHHHHHHQQQQQQQQQQSAQPPMVETGAGQARAGGRSTLAARLRAYRESAALRSGRVGPPPENGIGTRLTELEDTMPQPTVAPAYHDDVSPPSFLATVGKPPSYDDLEPSPWPSPSPSPPPLVLEMELVLESEPEPGQESEPDQR